uniref:limulus clotting factor C n=1 Tax=Melanoplus sanguinipes TaxID=65742 RepID=A0A0U4C5C4_MELSA|nr:serine protease-like protein [Melanoplus sanguinipes]
MVAILFDGYMNCGGSLINDRYVLTAGHCVHGLNVQNVTVMVGMNDLLTKSRLLPPVERLILHEEYSRDYLHDINDIALIKLAMPVAFSSFVSPICLPQNEAVDYTGNLAIVAGWGRVGQDEPLARYLRATEVRVISNEVCRNTAIGEHISDSMLCTYLEKKDACQGDSGGPLAAVGIDGHFEQIGVVSWGIGCARVNMPGVFTRVTKFMNWLRYNTRDANYCSRN